MRNLRDEYGRLPCMAKRAKRRRRDPVETVDYADGDGNVLRLRTTLSPGTIAKVRERPAAAAATADDAWQRREELLFERLAVSWEIAGLPLTDQAMLLGRYRMADAEMRAWVRETIAGHMQRYIPELG
jgi:hypothetical protein